MALEDLQKTQVYGSEDSLKFTLMALENYLQQIQVYGSWEPPKNPHL